jgi:hypothetical protein
MWYIVTGTITPNPKDQERPTYQLKTKEYNIEYAYKEELYNWIETKTFVYDETFTND